MVDTPSIWELNIWYHTLNCGSTTRISGETDFPCIYGERVGLGRSYVKLPKEDAPLSYDAWVTGMKNGCCYVSDGLGHLLDMQVGELQLGTPGKDGRPSVLAAKAEQSLPVKARAAAWLSEKPDNSIRSRPLDEKPYWHVERARIGDSRKVPVELIVNGESVARKEIVADGTIHDVAFDFTPKQSSWVALRIFPSAHTNPVFVEVDGKPIRANKRSAQWCLDAVDVCWKQKERGIRNEDKSPPPPFTKQRGNITARFWRKRNNLSLSKIGPSPLVRYCAGTGTSTNSKRESDVATASCLPSGA